MRRTAAIVSLALAWLCAQGAIWDVAQVLAWGKMFAGYAPSMTVSAALRETFDPANACELCATIATAKEQTEKTRPAPQADSVKIVLVLPPANTLVIRSDRGEWSEPPTLALAERTERVPLPPPRV